jgi:class 3 adenylate cyclase
MSFLDSVARVKTYLQEHGRVSLRGVKREFDLDDDALDEVVEELVDIQHVAVRDGNALAWSAPIASAETAETRRAGEPERAPRDYTPKHLADKILQSKSALEGERKQVTVLFADVKSSMELSEELDPEAWHRVLERFFEVLAEGVHRFEGTINQYTGDGIMALFGAPISHEDHAQRACYAALWLREALDICAREVKREHGLGLATRIGLHSGEVVVGKIGDDLRMDYTAQGHTVGLGQRMESLAAPNSCYLSEATARLVSGYFDLDDLGAFPVKGVSEPVTVFELRGTGELRTRFEVSRARGLSRFVGRGTDMDALESAHTQTRSGNGQVVGIVAEAGTGKSRLCFEFLERCRAQGMTVLEGRAVAHGKNIPLLPMLQVFRAYFGIGERDDDRTVREKIAGRLLLLDEEFRDVLPVMFEFFGVPDPDHPAPRMDPEAKQRQIFAVLRKIVQGADRRVSGFVTLIEDLHWLDPASEAFLEQWVDAVAGSSFFLLLNFRPEYKSGWMSKSYYRQIPLAPLGPEAVRELLDDLLGRDESILELADAIHQRTGGNPFFTEEVVQALIESGQLEGTRGSYRLVTPIDRLEVPASVQSLLASRIDRLAEREKRNLQAAAVIGKEFLEPILIAACEEPAESVRDALRNLKDGEFVYEQSLYPVAEYAFKHPLTQEVALHSQLRERRRRTHARVAEALEKANADHLDEAASLLAHHWEEAGQAIEAARWHQRAAEWAGTNDVRASLRHWQRVRELAGGAGAEGEAAPLAAAAYAQLLAVSWRVGGTEEEGAQLLAEGLELAERAGDLAALARLNANYSAVSGVNLANMDDYVRYAEEAIRFADRCGDLALRTATRAQLGYSLRCVARLQDCLAVCDETIELAGDDPQLGADMQGYSPLITARTLRPALISLAGDPHAFVREAPALRQYCLDHGFPEMALYQLLDESTFAEILGDGSGSQARAREALRLSENVGAMTLLCARVTLCCSLAFDRDWEAMREVAESALCDAREARAGRFIDPAILHHLARALLGLGRLDEARERAVECYDFMETTGDVGWNPLGYLTLAEIQLARREPAADVERTLAAYEAVIERTGMRLLEGGLREMRARVAQEGAR